MKGYFNKATSNLARVVRAIWRVCKIRPNSAEGYVALSVAFMGTAIHLVIVLIAEGLTGRGISVLVFGGLSTWVVTRLIVRAIDERRYRGIRGGLERGQGVLCESDFTLMGMGALYPREPTLLIYANPMFNAPGGQAQEVFRPADLYFNDGFVGKPTAGGTEFLTGDWGKLTVVSGMQGIRLSNTGITLDARFQRTRIRLAKMLPHTNDEGT